MKLIPMRSKVAVVARGKTRKVKSPWRQRLEWLQLRTRCLITRTEYDLYSFYEYDKDYRYMLNFLSIQALWDKFRPALNDPQWKVVLDNKWLFQLHYARFGIPVPKVYGVYDREGGLTWEGNRLANSQDLMALLQAEQPSSLVIKPLGGIMGKQVHILDTIEYKQDTVQAVTNTGETLTFEKLAQIVDTHPGVRIYIGGGHKLDLSGYLLQAKLEQHAMLDELAPYTTNTIRVVTFVDHAQTVHVHFTILRLGRQGTASDNWDRGGISVAVDPITGVLGWGVIKPKYGGQWVDVHPDSTIRITGKQLPYWDELIAVCKQAAQVTPHVRSVGWDVVITPNGPIIIEGNPDWGIQSVQVHTKGYLQPLVREQLAHFGLTFPHTTLPPINVRGLVMQYRERFRARAFQKRRH